MNWFLVCGTTKQKLLLLFKCPFADLSTHIIYTQFNANYGNFTKSLNHWQSEGNSKFFISPLELTVMSKLNRKKNWVYTRKEERNLPKNRLSNREQVEYEVGRMNASLAPPLTPSSAQLPSETRGAGLSYFFKEKVLRLCLLEITTIRSAF